MCIRSHSRTSGGSEDGAENILSADCDPILPPTEAPTEELTAPEMEDAILEGAEIIQIRRGKEVAENRQS